MTYIKFGNLEINSVSSTSAVSSGINIPSNWSNFSKTTEGLGKVDGDKNQVMRNITIVNATKKGTIR
jgi:hypothetical protein